MQEFGKIPMGKGVEMTATLAALSQRQCYQALLHAAALRPLHAQHRAARKQAMLGEGSYPPPNTCNELNDALLNRQSISERNRIFPKTLSLCSDPLGSG